MIELLVVNAARVSHDILEAAQLETTRIYASIGVRLAWTDAAATAINADQETMKPSSSFRLQVTIAQNPSGKLKDSGKLVGLATGTSERGGRVVYAFYQRLQLFAVREKIGVSQALGIVLAHEIGHLLLPSAAHATRGIMRAGLDRLDMARAARGDETFTPELIELIHHTLSNSQPYGSNPTMTAIGHALSHNPPRPTSCASSTASGAACHHDFSPARQ
jgi:hypothetical protein